MGFLITLVWRHPHGYKEGGGRPQPRLELGAGKIRQINNCHSKFLGFCSRPLYLDLVRKNPSSRCNPENGPQRAQLHCALAEPLGWRWRHSGSNIWTRTNERICRDMQSAGEETWTYFVLRRLRNPACYEGGGLEAWGIGCLFKYCEELTLRRTGFFPMIPVGRNRANTCRWQGKHSSPFSITINLLEISRGFKLCLPHFRVYSTSRASPTRDSWKAVAGRLFLVGLRKSRRFWEVDYLFIDPSAQELH